MQTVHLGDCACVRVCGVLCGAGMRVSQPSQVSVRACVVQVCVHVSSQVGVCVVVCGAGMRANSTFR